MKILKAFKDDPDNWFPVCLDECLDKTEGSWFYQKGTVKELLKEGLELQTPYAVYKMEPEN
jgi:hypothetical protein